MKSKDLLFMIGYIVIGVLTRTVFHIAPNVEFVTGVTLAGAYFIKCKYSASVPVAIMFISDLIIGNSAIYIFTWSAFGITWLLGRALNSDRFSKIFEKLGIFKLFAVSELGGVAFTIFFYLWTNLGVVVVSNLYPKTLSGLLMSYKMGVPFLVPQLIGNMIIVPSVFLLSKIFYYFDWSTVKNISLKSR